MRYCCHNGRRNNVFYIKDLTYSSMFSLSKNDTLIIKGIAICAMLFHHLYCSTPEGIIPYYGVLSWLGALGKVCVSLFLFCSGYGLSAQFDKVRGIKRVSYFELKRFVSFYLNYWTVFLLFVPLTVFLFQRPLSDAYGEHVNILKRLVYDLLGVQGFQSYNITWWFNKLVIILWLLFPLLYWLAKKRPLFTLLVSVIVARFWMTFIGWDYYGGLYYYQLPFVLGVVWQLVDNKFNRIEDYVKVKPGLLSFVSICLVVVFVYLRMNSVIPHWSGLSMDAFLSCAIALLAVSTIRKIRILSLVLSVLGKHSGNIYLIHTFFNGYWHPEWLHTKTWMRSGVNFAVLLMICFTISMFLEWAKEKIGVNKAKNRLLESC